MATMKEDLGKLKAGDTVWIVGAGYTRLAKGSSVPMHEGLVIKAGRKYLTVNRLEDGAMSWDGCQYHIDSGFEKTEHSHYARRLYIDIHAYAREQGRLKVWEQVKQHFFSHRGLGDGVTVENLREAARLLSIELKE